MKDPILLKFGTAVLLNISDKILSRMTGKWRHSDVITVLEDLIFPQRSSEKALPW